MGAAYNSSMNKSAIIFSLLCLSGVASSGAQDGVPPARAPQEADGRLPQQRPLFELIEERREDAQRRREFEGAQPPPDADGRLPQQRTLLELIEERREEARRRREAWRQLSPEERHQLRRDIRDAGDALYPRGARRRGD